MRRYRPCIALFAAYTLVLASVLGALSSAGFAGTSHLHLCITSAQDGKPLPNFFVYDKPWYRDGAMMAMAFEKKGNLPALKDWILGLRDYATLFWW